MDPTCRFFLVVADTSITPTISSSIHLTRASLGDFDIVDFEDDLILALAEAILSLLHCPSQEKCVCVAIIPSYLCTSVHACHAVNNCRNYITCTNDASLYCICACMNATTNLLNLY